MILALFREQGDLQYVEDIVIFLLELQAACYESQNWAQSTKYAEVRLYLTKCIFFRFYISYFTLCSTFRLQITLCRPRWSKVSKVWRNDSRKIFSRLAIQVLRSGSAFASKCMQEELNMQQEPIGHWWRGLFVHDIIMKTMPNALLRY